MGRIGKHSVIGLGRNMTRCDHCNDCEEVCPMGVRILDHPNERIRDELCTLCLDCVGACPQDAMELKFF